jgi:riboflavin kinase/FMN adenylyltransferase
MIVSGIVEKGAGIGKSEFVPTINLMLDEVPSNLAFGVYACRATVVSEKYDGVMHFGARTSVDNLITFEVNLFDFEKTVYGEKVEVEVLEKIREIVKFETHSDLKVQIESDIESAKKILAVK